MTVPEKFKPTAVGTEPSVVGFVENLSADTQPVAGPDGYVRLEQRVKHHRNGAGFIVDAERRVGGRESQRANRDRQVEGLPVARNSVESPVERINRAEDGSAGMRRAGGCGRQQAQKDKDSPERSHDAYCIMKWAALRRVDLSVKVPNCGQPVFRVKYTLKMEDSL